MDDRLSTIDHRPHVFFRHAQHFLHVTRQPTALRHGALAATFAAEALEQRLQDTSPASIGRSCERATTMRDGRFRGHQTPR